MSAAASPTSPGLSKRPGGKVPPKLPLALFKKASESSFPDPATIFPDAIIDANVALKLEDWMQQAGDILKKPVLGVVLSLHDDKEGPALDEKRLNEVLQTLSSIPITAVIAPIHIADRGVSKLPSWITSSPSPFAFAVPYNDSGSSPVFPDDIKLILSAHVVELDVQWDAAQAESDAAWNRLEEVIGKAVTATSDGSEPSKAIVISNLLPPPHSLMVPIVKLLSHPAYLNYQEHISSLSFINNVYLKFLPPSWQDPTPPSPAPGASFDEGSKATSDMAKEEWKRRVRMYLGPALEAFGYSRIIFGTSPSPSSTSASTAHDWYNLAREVIAEVGVEQEGVNAIFAGNAQTVYGRKGL